MTEGIQLTLLGSETALQWKRRLFSTNPDCGVQHSALEVKAHLEHDQVGQI